MKSSEISQIRNKYCSCFYIRTTVYETGIEDLCEWTYDGFSVWMKTEGYVGHIRHLIYIDCIVLIEGLRQ